MIRRLFCQHYWLIVNKQNVWMNGDYGCKKCGKLVHVHYSQDRVWRFKRNAKGELFDDE